MIYDKVKDLEDLKQRSCEEVFEGFIALNGCVRSSKMIHYTADNDYFWILNEIDDTTQNLKSKNLWKFSNIGEALDKGAFYEYKEAK